MYRSTPSCHATSVVAFSSRIAPLGAIRPPQAAAGSACVRKTARVAAAAGTSLLTIGNLLFRRTRQLLRRRRPRKVPEGLLVRRGSGSFEGADRLEALHFDGRRFPGERLTVRRPPPPAPLVVRDGPLRFALLGHAGCLVRGPHRG